ncbi:MAG TPA: hypothetical protein DDZ51_25720 [Planctomycetaceae bacterium]|nr:hypothetical protein [Planctomycetaceae bacterium]
MLFAVPAQRFERARLSAIERRLKNKFIAGGLKVRAGVFEGLMYPAFDSSGSCLFPKLIGTYELELQSLFRELSSKGFEQVVDIGAAEGYYAVGFARMFPTASVTAFDLDPIAREQCARMAVYNAVSNVSIKDQCTADLLKGVDVSKETLVLCDCEGGERELFSDEVAAHMRTCHIIIELHDYVDRRLTGELYRRFEQTHRVSLINSTPDNWKIVHNKSDVVSESDLMERRLAFSENRLEMMQWLIATPKLD